LWQKKGAKRGEEKRREGEDSHSVIPDSITFSGRSETHKKNVTHHALLTNQKYTSTSSGAPSERAILVLVDASVSAKNVAQSPYLDPSLLSDFPFGFVFST
jgi:hypothetical protein